MFLRVVLRWAGSKKWGDATLKELSEWELEHRLLCFASPLPALKERTLGLVLGSSFPGPRWRQGEGEVFAENSGGTGDPKDFARVWN